jgi:hypothetical protein
MRVASVWACVSPEAAAYDSSEIVACSCAFRTVSDENA